MWHCCHLKLQDGIREQHNTSDVGFSKSLACRSSTCSLNACNSKRQSLKIKNAVSALGQIRLADSTCVACRMSMSNLHQDRWVRLILQQLQSKAKQTRAKQSCLAFEPSRKPGSVP